MQISEKMRNPSVLTQSSSPLLTTRTGSQHKRRQREERKSRGKGEWEEKMNHEKATKKSLFFAGDTVDVEQQREKTAKKKKRFLTSQLSWGTEKTILNASMIFYQISLIINLNISEHRRKLSYKSN